MLDDLFGWLCDRTGTELMLMLSTIVLWVSVYILADDNDTKFREMENRIKELEDKDKQDA